MEARRSNYAGARALAVAVAVACGSAAQAQTAPQAQLEEVVVTATKREARLIDVPVAVTALDGDSLADRNLVRIEDFAKSVPGFSLQTIGTRGLRPVLRGQNTGGTGASVATMLDDIVLNTASALTLGAFDTPNIDTFDLERVEVLRGPQGTLYGATAQGGLLKFVTRKPDVTAFGAAFEAGVENVEDGETGWSAKGMLNLPFAGGTAAVRFVGIHEDIAGFVDNPLRGVKDENSGTRDAGRVSVLWQPTESLTLRLMAFKQKQDFGGNGQIDVVGATFAPGAETDASFQPVSRPFSTRTINPNRFETSYEAYNFVVDYAFDWATLTSSSSLAKLKGFTQADITDAPLGPPGVSLGAFFGAVIYGQPISLWGRQVNDHDKFNQEFRLESKAPVDVFGVPMDWQVGAFYSDEDITFTQYFDAYSIGASPTILTVPLPIGGSKLPARYKELAGFGDVTFKLSSRFELSVGGRYVTNDQESQVTNDIGIIGGGPVVIVNPVIETDETKFTYSFAPRFIVSDDVSIYARLSSGYRPGGPVLPIPNAPPDFPKSFDSDTTTNYELGAKGRLLDGRFTFDVAAFRIDWKDAQVRSEVATSAGTFTVPGNAGEATSQGFEWNLALVPLDGLTIGFNGAWIKAELTEDAPGAGALDGDELPYVPKLSTSLDVEYAWALASGTATAGVTWSHVGKQCSDWSATPAISNHVEIPDYDTLDARVGFGFGRYRLDVFARNLTNEYGLANYNSTGGFATAGTGFPIQPRTIGVRFGATF